MLVAEDARGLGAEGTAPLLEGQKSSDSTLRFVANRALVRLKWTPTPPAAPAANRPPRIPAERTFTGPCGRLVPRAHDSDLRVVLAAADSLGSCADDGSTLLHLAADANDNIRAGAISALSRGGQHKYDSMYIAALSAHGYQVVLAGATALRGSTGRAAVPALLAVLDRLTAERRENSRDERIAILARLDELGAPETALHLGANLSDYDSTVAMKAAELVSKWTGTTVTATPHPLPIRADRKSVV